MLEYWYIKRGLLHLEWGREVEAKPKTFCRKNINWRILLNHRVDPVWEQKAKSHQTSDQNGKPSPLGGVQDNFGTNSSSECILVLALVYSEK